MIVACVYSSAAGVGGEDNAGQHHCWRWKETGTVAGRSDWQGGETQ